MHSVIISIRRPINQLEEEDYKWINIFDFHLGLGIELQSLFFTLQGVPFFSFNRGSRYGFIRVDGPTLKYETSANQSYSAALEIIFYFGFLCAYAVKSPIIPYIHGYQIPMGKHITVHDSTELFTNNLSWIFGAALFFLAGTSYDQNTPCLSRRNGRNCDPNTKIFTMFSSFRWLLFCRGMSGFLLRVISFFGIITSSKYFLIPKILITFCNSYWNYINSYLFIIYVTSDVLWIQAFQHYKLLFFWILDHENYLFRPVSFLPVIGIGLYPDLVLSLSVDKES
ncbi:hypothetical protein H6P81_021582 [Aristolochia fimbriata]|uniref:Uncharacterized protein n=1 Tax=Aristolochia fimbriata TaxID=158543 RepID=A0AAV7DSD9_ARIFI|nr:hypothetical protein H6P81_021582 [Aristolochia fimbriata]